MKALVVKGSLSAEELSKIAKVEKDVRLNSYKSLCHVEWASYENTS